MQALKADTMAFYCNPNWGAGPSNAGCEVLCCFFAYSLASELFFYILTSLLPLERNTSVMRIVSKISWPQRPTQRKQSKST